MNETPLQEAVELLKRVMNWDRRTIVLDMKKPSQHRTILVENDVMDRAIKFLEEQTESESI